MTDGGRQGRTPPRRYKRPFDLALVGTALVALLPLWTLLAAVVAAAIRCDSPGPVLYRQRRLGRGGRVFDIVKFRTMRTGAEAHSGPVQARPGDPRATRVGRVLRRLRMDELPQAWNVLMGEMSLVGPRPERPELAARHERAAPGFGRRLAVRPGVMGLAQARGGYRLAPRWKLRYDELYIRRMGPCLDIRLCVRCVARVAGLVPRALPQVRRLSRPRRVDYLLVAGPGRSGSTYLFEGLAARGDFVAPAIKEGAYYAAPGRLARARNRLPHGAVLLDAANSAWRDPRLCALSRLRMRGCRVLVIVLLRAHVQRARSMRAFRVSRGDWRAALGGGALERTVVKEALTPQALARLFALGVDVLCVDFAALVRDPVSVLDRIAALCGLPPGSARPPASAVNGAVAARSRLLSAAGRVVATALRALGGRRLLARIKASARVRRLFFRPARGRPGPLSAGSEARLARLDAACRETVAAATVPLAPGLRLATREAVRAAPAGAAGAAGPRG